MTYWFTKASTFTYKDTTTKHHADVNSKEDNNKGGGGGEFGAPSSTSVLYQKLLDGTHTMDDSEDLPFTVIIFDPVSN